MRRKIVAKLQALPADAPKPAPAPLPPPKKQPVTVSIDDGGSMKLDMKVSHETARRLLGVLFTDDQ
jgi:hypothetical protein